MSMPTILVVYDHHPCSMPVPPTRHENQSQNHATQRTVSLHRLCLDLSRKYTLPKCASMLVQNAKQRKWPIHVQRQYFLFRFFFLLLHGQRTSFPGSQCINGKHTGRCFFPRLGSHVWWHEFGSTLYISLAMRRPCNVLASSFLFLHIPYMLPFTYILRMFSSFVFFSSHSLRLDAMRALAMLVLRIFRCSTKQKNSLKGQILRKRHRT